MILKHALQSTSNRNQKGLNRRKHSKQFFGTMVAFRWSVFFLSMFVYFGKWHADYKQKLSPQVVNFVNKFSCVSSASEGQ